MEYTKSIFFLISGCHSSLTHIADGASFLLFSASLIHSSVWVLTTVTKSNVPEVSQGTHKWHASVPNPTKKKWKWCIKKDIDDTDLPGTVCTCSIKSIEI